MNSLTFAKNKVRKNVAVTFLNILERMLYSGGRDGTIREWALDSALDPSVVPAPTRVFDLHTDWVNELVVLGEDSHGKTFESLRPHSPLIVVSCSNDGTVKLWSLATGNHIASYQYHSDYVKAIATSV